ARPDPPAFISPANDAQVDTNQPFSWTAVPGASEYCLTVGTTHGADDLVNSGPLAPHQTTYQAPALPTGQPLWARIYSLVDGRWSHADVSFAAATAADADRQAALTWPGDGQSDVGTDRPFTWSQVPWATNYWLTIGTAEGDFDLLNTGTLPASQSSWSALPPLPPGIVLYARLLTHDGEAWTAVDTSFTAAPGGR
ncbi:MAG: hypothetical protein M3083_22225, partial [Actinomycetota bacterium]|nr:hypothetical protein [Actinomycetota bacterium]